MKFRILLLLICSTLFSADTLSLTFGNKPDNRTYKMAQRYIQEVNSRLDSTLVLLIKYEPLGRSALHLCDGKTDGDLMRTDFVYQHCQNVVKVPVSLRVDKMYPYCRGGYHDSVTTHPDSSTKYVTTLGNRLVQYWKEKTTTPCYEVLDYRQALKMVQLKRADCFIGSNAFGNDSLLSSLGITMGSEPVITAENYLYLNRKHERHVGQLTKVLYELKEERFLHRLILGEIQ